jgi:putative SOS response-associated peptidase YedK
MCGRFASILPPEFIRRLFAAEGDTPNLGTSWNLAPSQDALVVRRHPETGARRLDALRWGLVPHFTKDLKAAAKPINARAESVATSGLFRVSGGEEARIFGASSFWRGCICFGGWFLATRHKRRRDHPDPCVSRYRRPSLH